MSQQLDIIARVALCGAIVDTYHSGIVSSRLPAEDKSINHLLDMLELETEKAFELFDRVTASGLKRVSRKIETIKKETSIGKPLSIVTFIDFALSSIDEPARKCKGERLVAIRNIVEILIALRSELVGNREYLLSSIAAVKASDAWETIEI
jgi:hypothetical protein